MTEYSHRVDVRDKVTGQAPFTEDVATPPGTLSCAILRSLYSHARIRAIDTEKAQRFPGVHAVVSREQLAAVAARCEIRAERRDLSRPDIVTTLAAEHDLVIDALPSGMGFQTLRAVIASDRPAVDVTFMPENALELDGLAREHGVAVVVDCGIAPGLSHMLAAFAARRRRSPRSPIATTSIQTPRSKRRSS